MLSEGRKIDSGDGESSSGLSKNDYEVFLSFRGPDTRQGFIDCLYHAMVDVGIKVFRDSAQLLQPGDNLNSILTVVDNSKLCVVVFSRTFAASPWCLREVERMIAMKKEILPIYYDVTPNDVKLKTRLYDDALTKHETRYGKEQVQKWRKAVMEIPGIKGLELQNSSLVEFSRKLAKEILTKLKVKQKYEIEHFVEAPGEVEDALKLLNIGSGERQFLGIHGMGGIGKTTLAKIIYNQIVDSFDSSCFLENIREYLSEHKDGLCKLQERLLKSLDPSLRDVVSIIDPMKKIRRNFRRKKVIIVLDDVDPESHIHSLVGDSSWFGIGSRIIFTTRNPRVELQKISSIAKFSYLNKREMDSKQALKLFSRHAFGEDFPPKGSNSACNEDLSVVGGLPVAIVVGSLLYLQELEAKVSGILLKNLKEWADQIVQQNFKLSYDAHLVGMEDQEKEVMSGASKLVMDTHSVGMEGQVKEVMKLLDVESGGMFVVGIYGSGGVGKTTLAKAIFDQLSPYFQVCSFIRDIRENSKCKGIQYLQDELHSKILCTNKDDEVETMKDKFFNKKILIVLDDVDKKEQIKKLVGKFSWFGSGSRIIITTRNKSEIAIEHEGFGSSTKEWPKFEAFEMRQMEHDLAVQLFNRHALGKDSCPNAYRIICNEIVEATGGFPLALEIVGSYLWHKTAEEWGSTLIMLKEACQQEIEETLKISYKALQYETQQIFLDIACFFCNKELSFPVYMWNACGYSPNQSIEALRLLSLIKIVDDNKLWMHDRVSDFGRKLVRENAMDPANRSRLWVHDEILYNSGGKRGT